MSNYNTVPLLCWLFAGALLIGLVPILWVLALILLTNPITYLVVAGIYVFARIDKAKHSKEG